MVKYIKMDPPKWATAMRIYIEVLKNPNADDAGKLEIEKDLMKLAAWVDEVKAELAAEKEAENV